MHALRQAPLALFEPVVFLYRFQHLPGAGKSRRKRNEIPASELLWLCVLRRHEKAPAQDIAGFRLIVAPGKARYFFGPKRPSLHVENIQLGWGWIVLAKYS
jgi:hypothetical protein